MTISSSFEIKTFFSHPDREIREHLEETWAAAEGLLVDATIFKPLEEVPALGPVSVHDMLKIIVFTHDMGKATSFFQSKMEAARKGERWRGGLEASHAEISAFFTLSCIWYYIGGKIATLGDAVACVVAYEIVARHHGSLVTNVSRGFKGLHETVKNRIYINQQYLDLRNNAFSYLQDVFDKYLQPLENFCRHGVLFQDVFALVGELVGHLISGVESPRVKKMLLDVSWHAHALTKPPLKEQDRKIRFGWFFSIKILNSILLESDKMNAAFGREGLEISRLPNSSHLTRMREIIATYKKVTFIGPPSQMDRLRTSMSLEVSKLIPGFGTIHPAPIAGKIFTLNAPTGSGKTLTSLELAGDIALALTQQVFHSPRLVYSLPFLSIIDQVSGVLDSLLQLGNNKTSSSTVIMHHHLTPMNFKRSQIEDVSDEDGTIKGGKRANPSNGLGDKQSTGDAIYKGSAAELLIWSWNAEIIVSTFHQLTAALYSNRNKDNLKFNKICQAIIILDEVQCLPVRYWLLIRETFSHLTTLIGTPILLMSATLPTLFPTNSIHPLLANPVSDYFKKLDRIKIHVDIEEKKTFDDLSREVQTALLPSRSYLIVVNTRECARLLHERLESLRTKAGVTSFQLEFMSSDVLASERRGLIDALKTRIKALRETPGAPAIVLVSTQVVEAGVDLDFDFVYRDIAPLDSVIQVAGRCNRNFDPSKQGQYTIVHLFQTCDDGEPMNQDYACQVYDPYMVTTTISILSPGVTGEQAWPELAEKYYNAITRYFTTDVSKGLVDCITSLDFVMLNRDFSLIEKEIAINVFLSDGEESEKIWVAFTQLSFEKDRIKRKNAFLDLKVRFEIRIINVRMSPTNMKSLERCIELDMIMKYSDDLLYVPPRTFPLVYDKQGFHLPKELDIKFRTIK